MHALGIRIRFSSASISYFFQHGYLFGHFTFHFYSLFLSFSQLLCFVFLHIFDWLTDSYLSLFCTVVLCVKFHKVVAPARASVLCRPVDFWISSCSGSSMRIKRIQDFLGILSKWRTPHLFWTETRTFSCQKFKWCHVVFKFSHGGNCWVRCFSGNVFICTQYKNSFLKIDKSQKRRQQSYCAKLLQLVLPYVLCYHPVIHLPEGGTPSSLS